MKRLGPLWMRSQALMQLVSKWDDFGFVFVAKTLPGIYTSVCFARWSTICVATFHPTNANYRRNRFLYFLYMNHYQPSLSRIIFVPQIQATCPMLQDVMDATSKDSGYQATKI